MSTGLREYVSPNHVSLFVREIKNYKKTKENFTNEEIYKP
jgi:hypothetical protein